MELTAYHIIQQQVFDIHIKRKDRYALLQNRFSRLFNNELFPLLETFIDREIPGNFNVRIETMTVDLGTVRYEYLEQDITRIFIDNFRKALHAITGDISVSNALPVAAEVATDRADRHLEIMEFFLFTGMLPWWAATENYTDHLAITDELLLHKKYEFRELLYRIGDNETVRKRLAWQFPETYIRSVIKILEPDKAGFIFQYHTEVTALQEDQQFVKSEAKEFEKAIWLFVLDYLLVERGSIFEERSFVKLSLYKMSMFFNVQYEELLITFYKAVQMVPPSLKRSGGLGLIIEYVYNDHFFKQQEQNENGEDTVNEAIDEETSLLYQLRSIEYFLAHGAGWIPFQREDTLADQSALPAFITRELVVRWLHTLIEKVPSLFITLITKWVYRQPVRQKRLYLLMDIPLLKKVSIVMAAQHETVVTRYFELLRLVFDSGADVVSTIADKSFIYQSAFEGILLIKQESANIPAFVRRHLLAVATHYNIDHKKLAKALLQLIIQQQGKNKYHTELVAGITALLTADEKELIEERAQVTDQYSNAEGKEITAPAFLIKLLMADDIPAEVKSISNEEWDRLVKVLLLTAYRKDAAAVKELLQKLPVQSAGFTTLYRLFSNATTIEERSLFAVISTVAEKKLIEWWQVNSNIQDSITNNLPEMIEAVMEYGNGETFMRLLQTETFRNWLLPVSLHYMPDQAVDRVFELIKPGLAKELTTFIHEFRTLLQHTKMPSIDNTALAKLFRLFIIELLSGKIDAAGPATLVRSFFDFGERQERSLLFRFYGALTDRPGTITGKQSMLSFLWPKMKQEIMQRIEKYTKTNPSPGSASAGDQRDKSSDAMLLMQIKNELNKKQKEEEKQLHTQNYPVLKEPDIEKIYVPNAGLVLLFPFYSTYFTRLGLLEQGKFKDAQARQRAVHLLAFIADGKEEHAEPTLPLNKILCGFPLKEPVEHTFSIQENERELSIQMLQVIFQRWEKLKNSSVEGFRESFLKRQGILTRTGEGWNLRVEQRGYDILLDTIPWGFRFIKSSWMDTILTVEWI